jgi:hypothetical protein
MRTIKYLNADWEVSRPLVSFSRVFAALALLHSACTPFLGELPVSREVFLLIGLCYSAFLAFFAIGISLLPQQTRKRVMMALGIGLLLGLVGEGVILASLYFRSHRFFSLMTQSYLWTLASFLAIALSCACYGWYHRFFVRRQP